MTRFRDFLFDHPAIAFTGCAVIAVLLGATIAAIGI